MKLLNWKLAACGYNLAMLIAPPQIHRFSREEYYQMADLGLFNGQRVELVHGRIIDMPAQRDLHVVALGLVQPALQKAFPGCWIRCQVPLTLPDDSEPEPDFSVVPGIPRDYLGLGHHPKSALLVVELSDTTLEYDRETKSSLYAGAGFGEYWIVNLVEGCVEVYTEPVDGVYSSVARVEREGAIEPVARPGVKVAVRDLLP
jgi:Uma2 family endonuclease